MTRVGPQRHRKKEIMNRNISPTNKNTYIRFLGQDAVCLGVKLGLAA